MNLNKSNSLLAWRSSLRIVAVAAVAILALGVPVLAQDATEEASTLPNIVLVHGAWDNGAGWTDVIKQLQAEGYNVTAPQFPLSTLEANVARLRAVLNAQTGPTIVAGHSFGGQVMTALGEDAPNVVGLVYIAAFGLESGETINGLLSQGPAAPWLANLHPDADGYAWMDIEGYTTYFMPDVDPVQAAVSHATQNPAHLGLLEEPFETAAWHTQPTWYMVAANDQIIPPDGQRAMAGRMGATVQEVASEHVVMASHPDLVVEFIKSAAATVSAGS